MPLLMPKKRGGRSAEAQARREERGQRLRESAEAAGGSAPPSRAAEFRRERLRLREAPRPASPAARGREKPRRREAPPPASLALENSPAVSAVAGSSQRADKEVRSAPGSRAHSGTRSPRPTRPNRTAAEVFKEFRKQYPSCQAFKAALSEANPPPAVSPAEVAVQPPKKVSVKVVKVRRRPRFEVDPEDL